MRKMFADWPMPIYFNMSLNFNASRRIPNLTIDFGMFEKSEVNLPRSGKKSDKCYDNFLI